ncbi:MAG: TIGR02147 family protein [Bdellovibrionota bacterium]
MIKPQVKKYLSAFQFLQDSYKFRKSKNANFSYEVWARELKISDKSYVRAMTLGNRKLSIQLIKAFTNNLKLDKHETEYFNYLVQYNQSYTQEQKELFRKKLVELLELEFAQYELEAQYEFLSSPIMPKLQVLLSMTDIDSSAKNLAQILKTTEKEIKHCLKKLESMKLIKKHNKGYKAFEKNFKIPDGFNTLGLESFYLQTLEAAKQSISLSKENRRFQSLFVAMNKEEFEKFLIHLEKFAKEQLVNFNTDIYSDRRLYQINTSIVAISEPQQVQS